MRGLALLVAGIDIGSMSAKSILLRDGHIAASVLILTGADSSGTVREVMARLLEKASLEIADLDFIVATGYGRLNVPFAHKHITEISCHARGAFYFFPEVRSILDVGGQDCKAIRCDGQGKVTHFLLNDKCAAGTGRYLERIAQRLELPLQEIGPRSLKPLKGPLPIDSACAVFAENDILDFLRRGEPMNDILAGVSEALTDRILALLNRVGVEREFMISGGVAKNIGIVSRLEKRLQIEARIAPDPQLVGAVGGALLGAEIARGK